MKRSFDIWIILITERNVCASLSLNWFRLLYLFCSQSSDYFILRFFSKHHVFLTGKPAGSLQGLLSIRALWSSYIAVLWLNPGTRASVSKTVKWELKWKKPVGLLIMAESFFKHKTGKGAVIIKSICICFCYFTQFSSFPQGKTPWAKVCKVR